MKNVSIELNPSETALILKLLEDRERSLRESCCAPGAVTDPLLRKLRKAIEEATS